MWKGHHWLDFIDLVKSNEQQRIQRNGFFVFFGSIFFWNENALDRKSIIVLILYFHFILYSWLHLTCYLRRPQINSSYVTRSNTHTEKKETKRKRPVAKPIKTSKRWDFSRRNISALSGFRGQTTQLTTHHNRFSIFVNRNRNDFGAF